MILYKKTFALMFGVLLRNVKCFYYHAYCFQ